MHNSGIAVIAPSTAASAIGAVPGNGHSVYRNDSGCAEAHRLGPEQTEYGEGILR